MANINIAVSEFECKSPVIGTTYRDGSDYLFNWTSLWDTYASYGLNVEINIYYSGDNAPYELYSGGTPPANASDFRVDIPVFDRTEFRIEFLIDGGDTCEYVFNIPYATIVVL